MPHYVSLMKWTSTGRMGLPAWRDRVEEGERTIEDAAGIRDRLHAVAEKRSA